MKQMEMNFKSPERKVKDGQKKKADDSKLVCCGQKMILADDHGTASCKKCGRIVDAC